MWHKGPQVGFNLGPLGVNFIVSTLHHRISVQIQSEHLLAEGAGLTASQPPTLPLSGEIRKTWTLQAQTPVAHCSQPIREMEKKRKHPADHADQTHVWTNGLLNVSHWNIRWVND